MREEKSYEDYLVDAANERLAAGATSPDEAVAQAHQDVRVKLRQDRPLIIRQLDRRARGAVLARRLQAARTRRRIAGRFWRALSTFELLLATAEVANQEQMDAAGSTFAMKDDSYSPILRRRGHIAGRSLKCLLITGLHARTIVVATETLEMLKRGYQDAADARTRTLYELTVVTWFLAFAPSSQRASRELCERFYISLIFENDDPATFDDETRGLLAEATSRWGQEYCRPFGWARKVLGVDRRTRVTLRHLERCIDSLAIRPWYEEFNHSVHAGAYRTVARTDFRRNHPNSTRSEYRSQRLSKTGAVAARLVDISTYASTYAVSQESARWDNMALHWRVADLACEAFEAFSAGWE